MKLFFQVFLALMTSIPAFAVKIGTVDLQQAIQDSAAGKSARESLEKEFNTRRTSIEKERGSLQKLQEDLQKSASVLSREVREKREIELQQKAVNFEKMVRESEGVMRQKEAEMTKPIVDGLRGLIPDLSRSRSVDFVMEKNSGLLYAVDTTDLTEELIRKFDEKNKSSKKKK
jgi:outer membrane protein